MLWFTADTHLGHANIIKYCHRPFRDIEQMDMTIIANWNRVVAPGDDVWHLGDFALPSYRTVPSYLAQLNGHVHMVWGNHDKAAKQFSKLFASTQDVKQLNFKDLQITLYHYAQRVWQGSHHGSWQLFGHSHGTLPNYHRSMDVGVDCHGFTPVSFEAIKTYMDKQVTTDHHPELLIEPWEKTGDRDD